MTDETASGATQIRRRNASGSRRRRLHPSTGPSPVGTRVTPAGVVPVLYIGGCQRSGSTLLDRMLGQAAGHASAGEIVHLWARGLAANELCGCGRPFAECPFWSEVGRVAFGGWGALDPDAVLHLQRRVDRNRYIFFMLWPALAPGYRRELVRYVAILDRLYRAIGQVGGGVIVDSSKHASTAFLLRRVPSVRLRVIHLVRDSRGVAYSLLKKVRRPEAVGTDAFMFRASPWRSSAQWLAYNAMFHVLRLVGTPTVRTRYEGLVRDPRGTLRRILVHGPGADEEPGFIDGSTVTLGVDHSVAGNPMRLQRGAFDLRVDSEWRTSMRPRDRRVTTFVTWPLLARYGYLRNADR